MTPLRTLLTALLLTAALPTSAQPDAPAPTPPTTQNAEQAQPAAEQPQPAAEEQPQAPVEEQPKLVLRELFVIQADRYDTTANNPNLVPTALPSDVSKTGRTKSTDNADQYRFTPMPLGVLTFQGEIDEPIRLRLELTSQSAAMQAHWPKDAIANKQLVGWESIRHADEQQQTVSFNGQADWLEKLRTSEDRLWFQSRDKLHKERFLLYDASFSFKPTIAIALDDGQYTLKTNPPRQTPPPLTVLLRKSDQGWSADALAAPWAKDSPTIATSAPATDTDTTNLQQALKPVADLLAQRGYNPQETELALGMIASAGFDHSTFSLVYILPEGEIDKHIQLKIKPRPDQVIRTAIVVVNNTDPDLGTRINALIDDLGSDQWLKRDRAQRDLIELGQAAIKKVQQVKNHKDPEVAFRARQILDAYDLINSKNRR